jgi:hypothetical protein
VTTLTPGELCVCGVTAVRTLGTIAYCAECVEAILRPLMASRGIPVQPRVDWGDQWFDVQCRTCETTWVGTDGEACAYCARRMDDTVVDQAALVLAPPDTTTVEAMTAWRERLKRAVDARVVTETQARYAFERAQKDAA